MTIRLSVTIWTEYNSYFVSGASSFSDGTWGCAGMDLETLDMDAVVDSCLNVTVDGIPLFPK